jgi:tRNA(Ile)-lysidine synthase
VAVAYSAGRDSTALLHVTAHAARELGIEVVALHVHHGLMPQADAWLQLASQQCRRWRRSGLPVRLLSAHLEGKPPKGESVEAWARRERRAALARLAQEAGANLILLAHHRRDQAETVLLQALRGAGPAGLAAMPRSVQRDGLTWARPWLEQPREAIEAYVRRYRLRHVDDDSNADPRFARGRLRARVWPALQGAFDDAEQTLAAAARRAQEADALLDEIAAADLATLVDGERLDVVRWRTLSTARRANALRGWLRHALGRGAPESLVERLAADLPRLAQGRWPIDTTRCVALYRGRLRIAAEPAASDTPDAQALDLSHPGVYPLPRWGGAIEVRRVATGGVLASALVACLLRPRTGGERFQARAGGVSRSLKKQYQAAAIPAWERDGPLVFAGERLLFVPGLGIDARWFAEGSGRGMALRWLPAV